MSDAALEAAVGVVEPADEADRDDAGVTSLAGRGNVDFVGLAGLLKLEIAPIAGVRTGPDLTFRNARRDQPQHAVRAHQRNIGQDRRVWRHIGHVPADRVDRALALVNSTDRFDVVVRVPEGACGVIAKQRRQIRDLRRRVFQCALPRLRDEV
ncbi:MAG: hypothetical protein VW405_17140 [Rhodospirillaceae bacterium]